MKKLFTPNEVSEQLGVSPITIRQWSQKGLINCQVTPGGHRRYTWEAIESCAKSMGISLSSLDNNNPSSNNSKQLKILVVDDNQELNEMIVAMLLAFDESIVTQSAFNGFEAGVQLKTTAFDLVLLDIMMPGMDGYQVSQYIKSAYRLIKIVGMTGQYSEEVVKKMKDSGADEVLRKPFSMDELIEVCELSSLINKKGEK